MLFTVLVVSLMLAIGLGISDLTFKQNVLSSLAKDSQLAFYQADSGVECGLFYDSFTFDRDHMDISTDPSIQQQQLQCGNVTLLPSSDPTQNYDKHFLYVNPAAASSTAPCFSITIDKTDPVKSSISSRGYSTCASTAQQVERGLNVTY